MILPTRAAIVPAANSRWLPVHPGDVIARRIRVLGSRQNSREFLYEALQIAATGKVKVITETYPLTEIATAYERVEQGKVRSRAVITMGD